MYPHEIKSFLTWIYFLASLILCSHLSCAQREIFDSRILEPDYPTQSESNFYPEYDISNQPSDLENDVARNLRNRELIQLSLLRRAINGDDSAEKTLSEPNIGVVRRSAFGTPTAKVPAKMKTIAIITAVSLLCITLIGGTFIYRRKKFTKRDSSGEFDFGGLRFDKSSPPSSLLSDTQLNGDRKLAHSAQMYHYQHQKQQMLAVEKAGDKLRADEASGTDDEVGDFTVYECPGLAETSQFAVDNPLFANLLTKEEESPNGSLYDDDDVRRKSEPDEANSDSTPTSKTVIES